MSHPIAPNATHCAGLNVSRRCAFALAAVLVTAGIPAMAQIPTTVRGNISAVSANTVTVKSNAGKEVEIQLGDKTVINSLEPLAVSDIKPGDFLAVTSRKNKDGSLSAFDVRRFPKPVNPGHRPFDGGDDQTMTNATLSATVGSAKERELVLSYEGGSQKVVLADNASITMRVPGERSHLVTGAPVSVTADADAGGKLTARSVEVRKPAVKP